MRRQAPIERVDACAYRIPTASPEGDGTYNWTATTLVTVDVRGCGHRGFGYSYGSAAMVPLIREQLGPAILGCDALAVEAAWAAMVREVRNVGRPGIASTAISALDAVVWDLKGKPLDLSVVNLLGRVRSSVPVYCSGGFTTYSLEELERQLAGWVDQGFSRVKMKVGADPSEDPIRVRAARHVIGEHAELMVDANGAYTRHQALDMAMRYADVGVTWFEEPAI